MFKRNDKSIYLNGVIYKDKHISCAAMDKDIEDRMIECDVSMYYINNITSCFQTPRVGSLIADICYAGEIKDAKYVAHMFNSLRYYPYNNNIILTDNEHIELFIERIVYWFPICKDYLPKYGIEFNS